MQIKGSSFLDEQGRTITLRGLNVGSASKYPNQPSLPSHESFSFFEDNLSFVDHPLALKEANSHFARIQAWGFNTIRLLVSWEALEHTGVGEYDQTYINYIQELVKRARAHDLWVIIAPQQDVWSRYTGGDGAPLWTLEKVGLDATQLHKSGTALLHHQSQDKYHEGTWAANYNLMATATMFSLFFGGDDFAPQVKIGEEGVQTYLQEKYIKAYSRLAQSLQALDNVIGFGIMNDPSPGWIGCPDLKQNHFYPKNGPCPSPFQSMLLGAGRPQEIEHWKAGPKGPKKLGLFSENPRGVKAWLNGFKCIWKNHGVWDIDDTGEPALRIPNYFAQVSQKEVVFAQDYWLPFIRKFSQEIRLILPQIFMFVDQPILGNPPHIREEEANYMVHCPTWFDHSTQHAQKFQSWSRVDSHTGKTVIGKKRIKKLFSGQSFGTKTQSAEFFHNAPVFISKTGIPFNLKNSNGLKTGNFKVQNQAMDLTLNPLEENLLHWAVWNYSPKNENDWGDQWNLENYSVFSREQQTDKSNIHSGGRALEALIRPYALVTAGILLKAQYNWRKGIFEFEFEHEDKHENKSTELFVPQLHFPETYAVQVSDGSFEKDLENQKLIYKHSKDLYRHQIRISCS